MQLRRGHPRLHPVPAQEASKCAPSFDSSASMEIFGSTPEPFSSQSVRMSLQSIQVPTALWKLSLSGRILVSLMSLPTPGVLKGHCKALNG